MAQTLRDIVSDLATDARSKNLDDKISFRYLANKFRDKFSIFLRQEARSREIFKHTGIWRPINCIELQDVATTTCGNIGNCYALKRSIKQIPDVYSTNYGILLKILTIDGLKEFHQLSQAFDYNDYVTREYGISKEAYWIENKYIYIPNTTVEVVKGLVIPKDPIATDKLNGSCSICTSPLDAELNYPEYLITLAKQEVMRDIDGGYKRVVEDERPNDNTNSK